MIVTLDDGTVWETTTRSTAWDLGDGTGVVALEGKAFGYRSGGGYSLERVKLASGRRT